MQPLYRGNFTDEQKVLNRQISFVHVCVERSYKYLKKQFISRGFHEI